MFPKNWNITRVKEEVSLVFEQMIKSGKFDELRKLKNTKFREFDSSGRFKIQIEFDYLGNITNAYPIIN